MNPAHFVIVFLTVCVGLVFSAPSRQFVFGTVEGVDLQSQSSGQTVHAYYGVPYSEPPVGELRFRPPVAFRGREPTTVISSNSFREACWQDSDDIEAPMSEDCLFLNIFSPAPVSQTLRKVMVWIHGGGLEEGDARPWMPTDLVADYDVIVVTVQYRLGYLGFLGTGDEFATGNNGLRDQVLALQWVKDNIRAFGGDPNDVTLFGESAGGISASIISLSPYAKGLFTKAVFMSGTALSMPDSTLTSDFVQHWIYELSARLGCLPWYHRLLPGSRSSVHQRVFDCMRRLPVTSFTGPGVEANVFEDLTDTAWAGAFVDRDFLPNLPVALLRNVSYLRENGVLDRAYMVGTTNKEGMMFSLVPDPDGTPFNTEEKMEALAYRSSTYMLPLTTNKLVTGTINFQYSYPRNKDGSPPVQGMIDLITDSLFVLPAVDLVTQMADVAPDTRAFYYVFDHYPQLKDGSSLPGTNHAMDLAFLFDETEYSPFFTFGFPLDLNTQQARQMKDVYRGTLTQFAKTGDPSRGSTGRSPSSWPRFDLKDRSYMALRPEAQAGKRIYAKRMSLWQEYLPTVASSIFGSRRRQNF